MAEERVQRRLAAILAADVVGYSRLIEQDESATLTALNERRKNVLAPLVSEHHGRIIKVMGDGVLVEFTSAVNAVACSVELQKKMAAANDGLADNRRIVLRIGINLGDVVVEGDDLFGDGVIIAVRLQAIADPGGVCISRGVHEQVGTKLALTYDDLGPREVKNIAKPIHALRVRTASQGSGRPAALQPPQDKPSIAILPFTNMSGDPEQEYFSDGIAENIITDLSRFRDLFVIARNSTFAYKGKAVKIQDVSRELGVRYVLEGSVQKSGDRVRVTAQLIDGATGGHLWAERYDRKLEEIFAVQDEVTETIVGTLATAYGGRLRKAWQGRAEGTSARNFQAFDCFLRAMETFDHFTKEDTQRARDLFHKAVELNPNYSKAIAKLAWTHMVDAIFGFSSDLPESWTCAQKFAAMAVERDDDEAWGHWALGGCYLYRGQHDRAIAELTKALELNPNDADAMTDYALFLSYAGQAEKAIQWAHKAMRLNPHNPNWYVMQLGQIYYDAHRYEDAIANLESLRSLETIWIYLYLAASRAALGHDGEAQRVIGQALKFDPQATIKKWITDEKTPYKDPKVREHLRESLRKAGLPE